MNVGEKWRSLSRIPLVRTILFGIGLLLIAASPLVGAIPGPGGVIVFAAGLALSLRYSEWAKRLYVRFKRSHPKKGDWADWGLRRQSALRRQALMKEQRLAEQAAGSARTEAGEEGEAGRR
jgi:hypothetical protein